MLPYPASPRRLLRFSLAWFLVAWLVPVMAGAAKQDAWIYGQALSMDEQPIPGIVVTLTLPSDPEFKLEATGDREGKFSFKISKAAGTYSVRLEGLGYEAFTTQLELNPGDKQDVKFRLVALAESHRRDAVIAYNEGVKAFEAQDFETAKRQFQSALKLAPDLVEPHLGLADILLRAQNYAEATPHIEQFLAHHPDHVQGQQLAYEIYRRQGDVAKAQQMLTALRGVVPAAQLALQTYNDGVTAFRQQDEKRAIELFQQALNLDPKLMPAHGALATALYNQELYDEALVAVDRLLALDPQNVQGRRIRFLVYDARDDQVKAREALTAYREVDPGAAAEILYRRADLDFRSGNVQGAKAALLEVLTINPDLPRAHYTLGLCYTSEGNSAKAKEHLQKFIALAPSDPEVKTAKEMLSYL